MFLGKPKEKCCECSGNMFSSLKEKVFSIRNIFCFRVCNISFKVCNLNSKL